MLGTRQGTKTRTVYALRVWIPTLPVYASWAGCLSKRTGAGSLFYVHKGTLHAHKNAGKGTGRMLMSQTPGGWYELFFEESGIPADDGAGLPVFRDLPDAAGIRAVAAEYGIEIPAHVARRTQPEAGREGPLVWLSRRGR